MEDNLFLILGQRKNEYLQWCLDAAEMDLRIVCEILQGKSTAQTVQEIFCSTTTVYRSVRKVKEFLLGKPDYAEILSKYIENNPPDFGDGEANSILKMLFHHYEEFNQLETEEIRKDFRKLYLELDEMSLQQLDRVIDTTCSLCRNHEMAGFVEGVKVGVRLGTELEA